MFYYGGDFPKPAVNPDFLRVYGHMLWPFVQRAILALAAKNIPFQMCEMDLEEKAQWHQDANGGLIPILESPDGTLIFESAVI